MLNPLKNSIYITCDAFAYAILGFYVYRFCWIKDGLEMAMHISYFSLSIKCRVGNLDCSLLNLLKFCQNLLPNEWTIVILLCPQQSLFCPVPSMSDCSIFKFLWSYFPTCLQCFCATSQIQSRNMILVRMCNILLHCSGILWCMLFLLHCSGILWCMPFQNHFCKIYGHMISWWRCTCLVQLSSFSFNIVYPALAS